MDKVIARLRPEVRADGLDETLLEGLKQRRMGKLRSAGAFTSCNVSQPGSSNSGLVSMVGAGQSIVAMQYAAPPDDAVAAERGRASNKRPRPDPLPVAPVAPLPADVHLSAGLPRGAALYGTGALCAAAVHDGTPAAQIQPPGAGPTGFEASHGGELARASGSGEGAASNGGSAT